MAAPNQLLPRAFTRSLSGESKYSNFNRAKCTCYNYIVFENSFTIHSTGTDWTHWACEMYMDTFLQYFRQYFECKSLHRELTPVSFLPDPALFQFKAHAPLHENIHLEGCRSLLGLLPPHLRHQCQPGQPSFGPWHCWSGGSTRPGPGSQRCRGTTAFPCRRRSCRHSGCGWRCSTPQSRLVGWRSPR